jgi:broad specificity phosphatase PhoE
MLPKTLILIRHAHRTTEDRSKDNGLSPKGQAQVKQLVKFAKRRLASLSQKSLSQKSKGSEKNSQVSEKSKSAKKTDLPAVKFYSSPKKRCIETVAPVAREYLQTIEIEDLLTEHSSSENEALYLARIDEFLDTWKYEAGNVTVVCSHGDWIPLAIQKLTGVKLNLRKSGWVEVVYFNGACTLNWVVQRHY